MKPGRGCRGILCATMLLGIGSAHAKRDAPTGPHAILARISSPQQLLAPYLPSHYRVGVSLSGPIADEMRSALSKLGFSAPQYEEVMERKGEFRLDLSNTDYALDTRDLVCGILNPVEIIDLTVNSIVKYHDPDRFALMARQTRAYVVPTSWQGVTMARVTLVPTGDRFGYFYEDRGVSVKESWLLSLTAVVDSASGIVYELSQRKVSREFTMEQSATARFDTVTARYVFSYVEFAGHPLPAKLELFVNEKPALIIAAGYRAANTYVVFDTRSVCYVDADASESCLTMRYGDFVFDRASRKSTDGGGMQRSEALAKAAELSQRAAEELRTGKIDAATRTLQKLAKQYPQTPQAVEARKLLSSLPGAF